MGCGKIRGSRGTMRETASDASGVDFVGFFRRSEGGFQRIGIGLEPVKESAFAEEADVGILGCVNVSI